MFLHRWNSFQVMRKEVLSFLEFSIAMINDWAKNVVPHSRPISGKSKSSWELHVLFSRLAPAARICFALSLARLTICTCCHWIIWLFVCLFVFFARFQDCRSMESFFPHRKNSFYAATYESYLNRSHSRRQNQSLVIGVYHYHNTNWPCCESPWILIDVSFLLRSKFRPYVITVTEQRKRAK